MTNCPCCKSANTQAYSCSAAVTHWCRDCSCEWNNERRSPDARNDALEAAAGVCEDVAAKAQYSLTSLGAHDCAKAIRSLKDRRP